MNTITLYSEIEWNCYPHYRNDETVTKSICNFSNVTQLWKKPSFEAKQLGFIFHSPYSNAIPMVFHGNTPKSIVFHHHVNAFFFFFLSFMQFGYINLHIATLCHILSSYIAHIYWSLWHMFCNLYPKYRLCHLYDSCVFFIFKELHYNILAIHLPNPIYVLCTQWYSTMALPLKFKT